MQTPASPRLKYLFFAAIALAGATYAAISMGPLWMLMAIPAFVCMLGFDQLHELLPSKAKPFSPILALGGFFATIVIILNLAAPLQRESQSPDAPESAASAAQPSTPATPPPSRPGLTGATVSSHELEAAERVYGLFLAELNSRVRTDQSFDRARWTRAMAECTRDRNIQGEMTAEHMRGIAACADQYISKTGGPAAP